MRRRERERSSVGRAKTRHLMARGGHPALSRSVSALAYHFLPPNIGRSPNNSDHPYHLSVPSPIIARCIGGSCPALTSLSSPVSARLTSSPSLRHRLASAALTLCSVSSAPTPSANLLSPLWLVLVGRWVVDSSGHSAAFGGRSSPFPCPPLLLRRWQPQLTTRGHNPLPPPPPPPPPPTPPLSPPTPPMTGPCTATTGHPLLTPLPPLPPPPLRRCSRPSTSSTWCTTLRCTPSTHWPSCTA